MTIMPANRESTTTDEVIREVRKIKEQLAQAFDFDIDRIVADAIEKQRKRGRTLLSPPVKQVAQPDTDKPGERSRNEA